MTTVAACQVRIDIDDPEATWHAATSALRQAAGAGAEIVVLPELTCTGSAFDSVAEAVGRAEPANGPTAARMGRLSAALGIVLIFGFVESNPSGERPYNSLMVLDRGDPLAVYRKTHLWNQEKLIFEAGDQIAPVINTSAGRLAAMICYDVEFPEMVRDVTLRGAHLIAVPANWPVVPKPDDERPVEVAKAQAGAATNRVFIAIADRCGHERGVDWFGSSVICDLHGFPVAGPAAGDPLVLLAELDLDQADDKRLGPHNDALSDLRLDLTARPAVPAPGARRRL